MNFNAAHRHVWDEFPPHTLQPHMLHTHTHQMDIQTYIYMRGVAPGDIRMALEDGQNTLLMENDVEQIVGVLTNCNGRVTLGMGGWSQVILKRRAKVCFVMCGSLRDGKLLT